MANEPVKNPFELLLDQFRLIVREELSAINGNGNEAKLLYKTKEAARLCSVPATWLAAAARDKKVKCRRMGHYVLFALEDLKELIESAGNKQCLTSPGIPVVYTSNDGKRTQKAKKTVEDDTGSTRGSNRDAEKLDRSNGTRGEADRQDHGISR